MIVKELIDWLADMSSNAVVKMEVGVKTNTDMDTFITLHEVDLDAMTSNGPVVTLIGSEV